MDISHIKTRFAPSPTGLMHLGNARTALFNALFAYHHQGVFLLRIEDTDQERSLPTYAQNLMENLRWLGLIWQEGPDIDDKSANYYQSERQTVYNHYYTQLIEQNQAYPCFCSPQELALSRKLQRAAGQAPRYAGTCAHLSATEVEKKREQGLKPTLRFRLPRNETVSFTDLVKGVQQFATNDIGDFIIQRADGTPAFFFCNAVDDALMGVTHVFRGEDHLTNTPRQQLLLQALNFQIPQYGHIALIVGDDGAPLSKRNGSLSINELQEMGWLSPAVINYLARLGHTYEDNRFLQLTELAEQFSVTHLGKAPAKFDKQQLKHWQQLAVSHASNEALWQWMGESVHALVPTSLQSLFIETVRANVVFPEEALSWAKILFTEDWQVDTTAQTHIHEAGKTFFTHALQALADSGGDYAQLVDQLKKTSGMKGKKLFMPLRAGLTGVTHGPEMANLLPLMGVAQAQKRLQNCVNQ